MTDGTKLDRTVRRTADEVRKLKQAQDTLKEKLGRIETQAERSRQELRTAQELLGEEVRAAIAEVRAGLHRVEEAVDWMEGRLHAQLKITPADLDTADDELRRLAEQARRGRHAEAQLLDAATRRRLQEAVDAAGRLADRIAGHDRDALRLSIALAASEPDSDEHRAARAAYRATIDALARDRAALPAAREQAADARRALDTDAAQRDRHHPQVEAGRQAARQLRERLRDRLSQAVTEVAHLPGWLRFSMGRQPSGDARWMDTATSLLAYRVTYGVTDQAVALGPHRYDDPLRPAWRDDLAARLQARRRYLTASSPSSDQSS